MKKLAEILTGPDTWCKGRFSQHLGAQHCLLGAVQIMLGGRSRSTLTCQREERRLDTVIRDVTGTSWASVSWFNDHPDTTWDTVARVVDAYDRARLLTP